MLLHGSTLARSFRIGPVYFLVRVKVCVVSLPILIFYYIYSRRWLYVLLANRALCLRSHARVCISKPNNKLTAVTRRQSCNVNFCLFVEFHSTYRERSRSTIKIAAHLPQHCLPWFLLLIFRSICVWSHCVICTKQTSNSYEYIKCRPFLFHFKFEFELFCFSFSWCCFNASSLYKSIQFK